MKPRSLLIFSVLSVLAFWMPAAAADSAPAPAKTTYVLVHGAWGGGWAFKEVDRLLSADGSKVYRPTLTGLGEKNHLARPDVNLTTHINDVVNLILWEDLHDVVLMGHSYGGMVITGVIDRIPDRIKRAVYLDAILPNNGECVFDLLPLNKDAKVENNFLVPPWVKDFNAPPPHDMPHPLMTMSERIALSNPAAAKVAVTYILTVDEGTQPQDDRFYPFYERANKRGWETLIMAGDHNVQWSHPRELAELIKNSVGHSSK
jgi:pimeloyl-ACP methyl ester carboxylesterase